MNEYIHNRILTIMRDRGLSSQDDYRAIARELGKRGAKVKAAKAKKSSMPEVKKKHIKLNLPIQGEFKFEQRINYILKDLLF